MTEALARRTPVESLVKLRDLFRLIGAIRDIEDPFTSREGLRRAITLLVDLAELIGLSQEWIDRIKSVAGDGRLLDVFLAVIQYVLGLAPHHVEDGTVRVSVHGANDDVVVVDQHSLIEWLPVIIQIIGFLQQIRGNQ